jgi:hypothetical protein
VEAVRSRLGAAFAVAIALVLPAAAHAAPPSWSSVKVQGPSFGVPWTEPRITAAPDGTLWAVTNAHEPGGDAPAPPEGEEEADERSGPAIVLYSTDGGNTWHKTNKDPGGQTIATPDVDIVTLPNGRVISTELDDRGINFPTAFSDDRGKNWTNTRGSNEIADQDRQWLAAGPNPTTRKTSVYLLFHNLASGNVSHNMFVARSDDGGATFGVPVPITLPGEQSFNDLQCADSGGPSTIFVNQRDGTIYAEFTTRGTPIQGVGSAGGCATPLAGQPLEFNIVAGTRVWFAQSKDGGQTWTKSLPVDDAATGQIVSMQIAYAGLDTAGNVYVAYPESPPGKQYPDYSGAGVKYKWAAPAASAANLKWSDAKTLEPADSNAPGHVLVHMTVGDPGRLMGEFWEGSPRGGQKPVWHMMSAQTLNGLSAKPTVTTSRISDVPADTGDAGELMGACLNAGPISGLLNGLACGRSPDVWGVTLDSRCMTHVVWPAVDVTQAGAADAEHVAAGSDPGTFVSNQTGGSSLCASAAARGGTGSVGGAAQRCRDRLAPVSRISARQLSRRLISLRGRSHDRGCVTANGLHSAAHLARVDVSVAKVRGKGKGKNCRFVGRGGRLTPYRYCRKPVLLHAKGLSSWRLKLKVHLPRGKYRVVVRGTDKVRNKEKPAKYNHAYVRVR